MKSIIALATKDLRILMRVRSGLFFTFVWPIVVAILFGLVFSAQSQSTMPALRVVVVDEDNTDASRAFVDRLAASGDFSVDRAPRAEAETMVRRRQRSAFVVIKPGFGEASARMFYGTPRQLEIGSDPARQAEASMLEGLLMKHATTDFQRLFTDTAASRTMVGKALTSLDAAGNRSAVAPLQRFLGELDTFLGTPAATRAGGAGSAEWQPLQVTRTAVIREQRGPSSGFEITFPQGIMWGIIGCVMTFAIGLVSERVHGTYVRLRMAPLTRVQILAGKALACAVSIGLLQIMLITIGVIVFGIRVSSPALLTLAFIAASVGFVGFMMMIAGLGRTEQAVAGAGWAMLMPLTLFGGGMMPQFIMPSWMQTIGNVSPVKWALLGFEGAIWRGFTLNEMLLPCAILFVFGAVCFAIGVRGLREA
jgi:ABC-2 type transport system permease protein